VSTLSQSEVETAGRFRDLVAAEWIRYRSLPSSSVALALLVLTGLAASAFNAVHLGLSPYGISLFDPLGQAFDSAAWATLMAGAAVIGAVSQLTESGSGSLRTTLIAVPGRRRLIAAKAAMLAAVTALVGTGLGAASLATSQLLLAPEYRVRAVPFGPALTNIVAGAVVLAVCALVGLALAVLLRGTVATVSVALVLIAVVPNYVRPRSGVFGALGKSMPRHVWEGLTDHIFAAPDESGYLAHGLAAWAGAAVWAAAALAIAVLVLDRRDA
jgi:hypothetical protein